MYATMGKESLTMLFVPLLEGKDKMRIPGRSLLAWQGAPWAGGSLLLVLTAVVLLVATGTASTAPSAAQHAGADDITYGAKDARVVFVEYSDFQCEVCAVYATTLSPLREKYKDSVLFVFRFFPLAYHQNGMSSAQAAYAASLQGKFWPMHDLLYQKQKEWAEAADPFPTFESYAAGLGLDMQRFRADYVAPATKEFVTRQKAEGDKAGVTHTPWFIVNDTVVTPLNPGVVEGLLQNALADPSAPAATTTGG
jgi:protein-disulfide isomerase